MKTALYFGFALLLAATPTALAVGLTVLDTEIDAAPNQQVVVMVTGQDEVQGMDLYMQVLGAPLALTGVSFTGSIWEPNMLEPINFIYPNSGLDNAQYALFSVVTQAGTVPAPGIAATVIVDATGLGGQQAVMTANCDLIVSDFADIPVDTFVDGTITVRSNEPQPANLSPTIDAGPTQTVASGEPVTLVGSASDPEHNSLSYTWARTAGPEVTLYAANSLSPSFTAPTVTQNTTLTFRLTVFDGTNTVVDTVDVTVVPPPADSTDETNSSSSGTTNNTGTNNTGTTTDTATTTNSSDQGTTSDNTNSATGDTTGNQRPNNDAQSATAAVPGCGPGLIETSLLAFASLTATTITGRRRK